MDPNERLTGIAQMAPAGMGGPPMGAPPPPPEMMGGMGAPPPEMVAAQQEGQGSVNVEEDAAMLAETVIGRTGDPNAAVAVLEGAIELILQQTGGGDPMMTQEQPIMANMGGPLYREDGGTMSDTDLLRQMIMSGLQDRTMSDNDMSGRALSDRDQSGRTMSDRDMSGRPLSNITQDEIRRYMMSS